MLALHSCPLLVLGLLAISDIPVKGISSHSVSNTVNRYELSIQSKIRVHPRILHLFPNLRADNINLLLRVAQHAREKSVGESLEAFHDLEVVPGADFFLQIPYQ